MMGLMLIIALAVGKRQSRPLSLRRFQGQLAPRLRGSPKSFIFSVESDQATVHLRAIGFDKGDSFAVGPVADDIRPAE